MELDFSEHRFQHTYIIGRTGTGKSTTVLNYIIDDIYRGDGVLFIDPHGTDTDTLLRYIPEYRRKDTILVDLGDTDYPVGLNLLADPVDRPRTASALVDVIKSVSGYSNTATPVLNRLIYNCAFSLFDYPSATILDIRRMLIDDTFRRQVVPGITDPVVKSFWIDEYNKMDEKQKVDYRSSTLNNLDIFLTDSRLRNILCQPKNKLSMSEAMKGKVVLIKLPMGDFGPLKVGAMGRLILSHIHMSALARDSFEPFHVYLDECHHFAGATLEEMLSGIRKFRVSLTMSHQYLNQLPQSTLEAIMGNVGTKIAFRVGINDGVYLATELGFDLEDALYELEPFVGRRATPFGKGTIQGETLPEENEDLSDAIRASSRRHYAVKREKVERSCEFRSNIRK